MVFSHTATLTNPDCGGSIVDSFSRRRSGIETDARLLPFLSALTGMMRCKADVPQQGMLRDEDRKTVPCLPTWHSDDETAWRDFATEVHTCDNASSFVRIEQRPLSRLGEGIIVTMNATMKRNPSAKLTAKPDIMALVINRSMGYNRGSGRGLTCDLPNPHPHPHPHPHPNWRPRV